MKIMLVVIEEDVHNESTQVLGVLQFAGKLNYKKIMLAALNYLKSEWPSRFERRMVDLFVEDGKGKFDKFFGQCYQMDVLQPWQNFCVGGKKLEVGSYFVISISGEDGFEIKEYIKL